MYSLEKKKQKKKTVYGKELRDEHVGENYKILKQTFFKSVRLYDISYSCIK